MLSILILNKIYFSLVSCYENRRDSNKIFSRRHHFKEKITYPYIDSWILNVICIYFCVKLNQIKC